MATLADANAAVPVQVTTSPLTRPPGVQLASVALVVRSYVLFDAVTDAVIDFWFTVSAFDAEEALKPFVMSTANDAPTAVG